jgi:hypothetical protein
MKVTLTGVVSNECSSKKNTIEFNVEMSRSIGLFKEHFLPRSNGSAVM